MGDPESDIPGQLFPKHVQGLHASGDMAFFKDFEILENTAGHSHRKLYPDIITGGGGSGFSDKKPVLLDTWLSPNQFVLMSSEGVLATAGAWRYIWENQIGLIVSIYTAGTRDDLAQISDSKFFGEFQVQLENETVAPDYSARNMKVRKGRQNRQVTQLLYTRWDERTPRSQQPSFLSFVKSASASILSSQGRVLVNSRPGEEGGIYLLSLHTMLRQLTETGDVNLSAYSRYLATRGILLSTPSSYVGLHDTLAIIIDSDNNRRSYAV